MSDETKELEFLSDTAMRVYRSLKGGPKLGNPSGWIKEVERRAILAFVNKVCVAYQKHNGSAVREDMIIACAEFGVKPTWFFDVPTEQDDAAARELRADVARYRILKGLD